MYCDALCPVFPKLPEMRDFAPSDLHYLAHLCHNCRTCWDVCQYAPPHVFAVNLPVAFAAQRRRSYAEHVWPRGLAPAFRRPALGAALFALAALATMLAASSRFSLLTGLASATLLWACVSLSASSARFWITIKPATPQRRPLRALIDIVTLRHLGGELGCSAGRRPLHHLMAAGLGLDLLATLSAAALRHIGGIAPPYPLASLPVMAGAAGGLAALAASAGLLALEARPAPRDPGETALNVVLLSAIALVTASGLALLALRDTAAMRGLLALHLGTVCGLFAMLPASKLLHAPFRAAALWRAAAEDQVADRRVSSRDG
jgi:citrate/tricarballylate utilization protein